ncbi:IS200/IS605 family transposase [uncultured Methylobacterium sp.]|uniref:IS200/IS605 family transposase n=1 Tax=uncultured Methylobacterium sp. TaxID=157278 RepID=UPI0025948145|nr:IS200/IS605 family transposase [uncultured Methylobacterium sp.]
MTAHGARILGARPVVGEIGVEGQGAAVRPWPDRRELRLGWPIHLFVEADPTLAVAEIVNRFKGRSSRLMRQEFPALRSRLPTLWSRSYYAGSVGYVSAKVVEAYIAAQKGT